MRPEDRTAIDAWLDKVLEKVLDVMLREKLITEEEAKRVGLTFNEVAFEENNMKPSVGRIVHYQSYGTPKGEFKPLPRAAIITQLNPDGTVGLCAINPTGLFFHERCVFSETPEPGCWSWPPRVE